MDLSPLDDLGDGQGEPRTCLDLSLLDGLDCMESNESVEEEGVDHRDGDGVDGTMMTYRDLFESWMTHSGDDDDQEMANSDPVTVSSRDLDADPILIFENEMDAEEDSDSDTITDTDPAIDPDSACISLYDPDPDDDCNRFENWLTGELVTTTSAEIDPDFDSEDLDSYSHLSLSWISLEKANDDSEYCHIYPDPDSDPDRELGCELYQNRTDPAICKTVNEILSLCDSLIVWRMHQFYQQVFTTVFYSP